MANRALTGHARCHVCSHPKRLLALVRKLRPAAVLLDLGSAREHVASRFFRQLRQQFPSVVAVGCVRLAVADIHALPGAVAAGITDIAVIGHDDIGAVVDGALKRMGDEADLRAVLRAIAPHVPAAAWTTIRECGRAAARGLSVTALARELGMSQRTLLRRLVQWGLPRPAALIGWLRLLVAARLLEHSDRTVSEVAKALKYPSSAALRRAFRRGTGLSPTAVRREGGVASVVAAFVQTLSSLPGAEEDAPATERGPLLVPGI